MLGNADANFLRGNAFLPLTIPGKFQKYYETREKGNEWLAKANKK